MSKAPRPPVSQIKLEAPLVKPPQEIGTSKISRERTLDKNFTDELVTRLSKIKILNPQDNVLSNINYKTEDLEKMISDHLNKITYKRLQPIHTAKFYYHRPSLLDLDFEDLGSNKAKYNNRQIVEWNINDMSNRQILITAKYVTMFTQAARTKGNFEQSIYSTVISGFIEKLQGWWDKFLPDIAKSQILSAKKLVKQEALSFEAPMIEQ